MPQIPQEHLHRYFYHFTHIDNLSSIISNGLLSTNLKKEAGLNHVNVASYSIQERRSSMAVTCGPKGTVHDYVPFYFCSVNPMFLSLVNSKNVDQNDIIILAVPIEKLLADNVVFTDASANTSEPPTFYSNPQDLASLNWPEIDSQKWGCANEIKRHQKMAEVLVHQAVPLDFFKSIIVYNEKTKKKVIDIFDQSGKSSPKIEYSPIGRHNFFFTKFMVHGQENSLLVTGPRVLREKYENIVKTLIDNREKREKKDYLFADIADCLAKLKADFCAIKELKGIYKLETENDVHSENVSDHTLNVVEQLKKTEYYNKCSDSDKNILEISAYLHDIGKGPAEKWAKGKQPAYPDHPADAAPMVARILNEDFKNLSNYEIRMICMLVIYHDLIGEIFGKNRDPVQLQNIINDEKDFDMLSTLNMADIAAINWMWHAKYKAEIDAFKQDTLEKKGLR
ncbi:type II toxin-antitoxin system toxin DNA ADP-ribosyl transferase DarT [Chitinophaga sp. RAB17]|uniref:type II toxin-antitoxin system toxin DNA ADP-ribosyl transferase DarT n=1 Tax=Chitinophaga sp. RAB17 TaxID=3233049 RepID=UPI003F9073F6